MADDVILPPAPGTEVATRSLTGDRQVQLVQPTPHVVNLSWIAAPATAGGYSVGQQIGAPVKLTNQMAAMHTLLGVQVLALGGGSAPAVMPVGYCYPAGTAVPGTLPGDGDTFAPDLEGASGGQQALLLPAVAADWAGPDGQTYFRGATAIPGMQSVKFQDLTDPTATLVDCWWTLVALEDVADDLTAGLFVNCWLDYVCPNADVAWVHNYGV